MKNDRETTIIKLLQRNVEQQRDHDHKTIAKK